MADESYMLTGKLPDGTMLRIVLTGERLTVGRPAQGRPCDIVLGHDTVSHSHALLERRRGGWIVSDAGSRNGTKVNGIAVARQMLADGDVVSFGNVSLTYRSVVAGGAQAEHAMETRVVSKAEVDDMSSGPSASSLVGRSVALQNAVRLAVKAARARTEPLVTISGESGTGKELFARLIYDESRRRDGKFVIVNCGALGAALVDDTLFGHVKGAFTNADKDRAGVFEEADGGTVFLDEIGELSAEIQVKLLRVIQEKTLTRLGSNVEKKVDVRIVCATNRDLRKMVAEKKFREDLYYRLNVISIVLPPLRERTGDIEDLIRHFVDLFGGGLVTVSDEAMKLLCKYSWPGNVRELRNVVERIVTLAEGEEIQVGDLPPEITDAEPSEESETSSTPAEPGHLGTLEEREIAYIQKVLDDCGGNVSDAARVLDIGRSTLNAKIAKFGLRVSR